MKLRKLMLMSWLMMAATLFLCGIAVFYHVNMTQAKSGKEPYSPQPEPMVKLEQKNPKSGLAETKKPVNLVVFGLDDEEVRSDVIVLMNFDPGSSKLNILSIPRDTRVDVNGHRSKINSVIGVGGEKLAISKIEGLTGMKIQHYLTMNFKGFRKMIDVLDGVQIDVPMDMDYDDPDQNLHIHLRKGLQTLDGRKAEHFVRYRKGNHPGDGYIDGDIGRMKMQQEFIKALIRQKLKVKYLSKADDIYFILKRYVRTNVEFRDVEYYLKSIINIQYDEIRTFTSPGEPMYSNNVWYFIPNQKMTRKIIEENFYQ